MQKTYFSHRKENLHYLINVEIKVCTGYNFPITVNCMHFVLVRHKDRPVQMFENFLCIQTNNNKKLTPQVNAHTDLSVASSISIYWASLVMVIAEYNFR